MARQKGIIVIKGTIDGLNFYVRSGQALVRKAGGGFNGDAIKKKATMVRVRENGSEFGGCMRVTQHFKRALRPLLVLFKDGTMHYRLVQLFTQIKDCDVVSERGKRRVGGGLLTELGKERLRGYLFTPGFDLQKVLKQSFRFEWGLSGFCIDSFSVSKVGFPKGASHMELIVCWLVFDFEGFDYEFHQSDVVLIGKDYSGSTLEIPPVALPEGNGVKVGVVFLRFVQEVNGVVYPMKEVEHVVLEVVYVG